MFMIFFSEVVIYVLFNIKYNVFNSLICEVKIKWYLELIARSNSVTAINFKIHSLLG